MPIASSAPLMTTGAKPLALGDELRHLAKTSSSSCGRAAGSKTLPLGDDDELREVDRVGALAQDLPLRPALAAARRNARTSWKSRAVTFDASVCVGGSGWPSRAKT